MELHHSDTFSRLIHLLDWHAANCVAYAERCKAPLAKRVLRQLAADLLIEAETRRSLLRATGLGSLERKRYAAPIERSDRVPSGQLDPLASRSNCAA